MFEQRGVFPLPPFEASGACCGCRQDRPLMLMVMLPFKAPGPGKGWGCVLCGLPSDGAVAVLCEECFAGGGEPADVCTGYALEPGRLPVANLALVAHDHDPDVNHD